MKDVRGIELEPGQTVAFADMGSNVAIIRTGVIEEIVDAHGKVTIRWDDESVLWGPAVSTISVTGQKVHRPRLAVIN